MTISRETMTYIHCKKSDFLITWKSTNQLISVLDKKGLKSMPQIHILTSKLALKSKLNTEKCKYTKVKGSIFWIKLIKDWPWSGGHCHYCGWGGHCQHLWGKPAYYVSILLFHNNSLTIFRCNGHLHVKKKDDNYS